MSQETEQNELFTPAEIAECETEMTAKEFCDKSGLMMHRRLLGAYASSIGKIKGIAPTQMVIPYEDGVGGMHTVHKWPESVWREAANQYIENGHDRV
jgi:hypothetical protein